MAFPLLKKSDVRRSLPRRLAYSHKGENGKVLVIGGSIDFFGAPILTGLGSLYGGSDLTYLLVPECNFDVSRSFYPDFIVRPYGGDYFNFRANEQALKLASLADVIAIGPGLSKEKEVLLNLGKLLPRIEKPIVLDADALPSILTFEPHPNRPIIITPHLGEFNAMIEETVSLETPEETLEKLLREYSQKWNAVIVLKGPYDRIIAPDGSSFTNVTGNSGMTVGGTGDVLAGLIAALMAQGMPPFLAASCGAFINGSAGDMLLKQKGFAFSATDLALELPYTIHEILA